MTPTPSTCLPKPTLDRATSCSLLEALVVRQNSALQLKTTTTDVAKRRPPAGPPPVRCLLALHRRAGALPVLENLGQHVATHLARRLNPVHMQNRRRNIEYCRLAPHQPQVSLDPRPYRNERPGNVLSIREIVFCNHRCRAAVVYMHVRVFLELPQ